MADNRVRLQATLDDKVSGPLDRIRDKFDLLGGKGSAASLFGNVGAKAVATGFDLISDASSAATSFLFDSIDAASDLNEAMSKSQAVFGDLSDEMESWASKAADSFGQSKRSALEAAGTYGNLFQAFGIGQQKAAEMSRTLVELASDLASFNNTSVEEAITALRSGLSGETEPLKRFGVAINDVRLKEEALRLGLIKTTSGVLPQAIKSQAAYALIMKDTVLAQGDAARTSDGLAGSQRFLAAALEELQAEIGEELLPIMVDLATFAKDDLIPAFRDVIATLKDAAPVFQAFGYALVGALQGPVAAAEAIANDQLKAARQAVEDSAKAVEQSTQSVIEAVQARRGEYGQAAEALAEQLPEALTEAKAEAVIIAAATPGGIAAALRGNRSEWQGALDQLAADMEGRMSRATEIAKIKGALTSSELAAGLKSRDPVVRAQAEATKKILETALSQLGYVWGQNLATLYAGGILSKVDAVASSARIMSKIPANYLKQDSPAEEGPLSEGGGSEGWGERFGTLYAKGLEGSQPKLADAAASFAGSFLAIPAPSAAPAAGQGDGGVTIALVVDGRTLAKVVDQHLYYDLQRAAPTSLRS